MSETQKPIGFILHNPGMMGRFRNLKKNTFEPYTTGEFLNYPEHWRPVYEFAGSQMQGHYVDKAPGKNGKPLSKLALAISITATAFENKLDKAGQPYILHCLRVMNATKGDECTKCAAIMHDLIEDTEYTFKDLTKLGFSDKTIGILHLLTHKKETDYMEYIKAIAVSDEATEIKLRDLEDNSNITRLKGLGKKDMDRIEKYHRAYVYLNNK